MILNTLKCPLIIRKQNASSRIVLDVTHLSSNTGQLPESWPMEPLATQLARANKNSKSSIELMYTYAHATIDNESFRITRFSFVNKLFAFIRGFYGLKGSLNFFTQQMYLFVKDLIGQGSAPVYIADIVLMSSSKPHMLKVFKQLHYIALQKIWT